MIGLGDLGVGRIGQREQIRVHTVRRKMNVGVERLASIHQLLVANEDNVRRSRKLVVHGLHGYSIHVGQFRVFVDAIKNS